MASMVSPDNAPRTLEGLAELSRAVRYRLALNMEIVSADPNADSTKAFLGSDPTVQCQTLLDALTMRDGAGGGSNGAQQAPPQQQQQAPAPMQPMGQATPAAMQPMGGQQGPAPMQPMGQQPAPAREPSTPSDPTNSGAGVAAAPAREPAAVNPEIVVKLDKILAELETCAGVGETEELKELMLGVMQWQRIITVLCLEVAENVMGMDKATILGMVAVVDKSGEIEELLNKANGGKG